MNEIAKSKGVLKYSFRNSKNGLDLFKESEVKDFKKYSETEIDWYLTDGKTICQGVIRNEMYGKSGSYLKLVENIEFKQREL